MGQTAGVAFTPEYMQLANASAERFIPKSSGLIAAANAAFQAELLNPEASPIKAASLDEPQTNIPNLSDQGISLA